MSAVLIDPFNPDHLLFGTGATIYGTKNVSAADVGAAPTWEVEAQGIEETAVLALISPTAGVHLLSGVGDIGGFQHTDFRISPPAGMYTNPVAGSTGSMDWAGQNPNYIVREQGPDSWSTAPCNFGAFSKDNGTTWSPFPTCATGASAGNGGNISVDASGSTVMWTTPSWGWGTVPEFSTDNGTTWTPTTGLTGLVAVYSDKVLPQTFYAFTSGSSAGNFYSSTVIAATSGSGGITLGSGTGSSTGSSSAGSANFTQVNTTPLPVNANCWNCKLTVNFAKAGDIWLPLGTNGLYHSTDGGVTWMKISNVPTAYAIAVGAARPGHHEHADDDDQDRDNHPEAVFLYGTASPLGISAIYRSDNNGSSWIRINDDAHQYGGPSVIQADPRVYGRIYLGMNGRGIIYGDIHRDNDDHGDDGHHDGQRHE